MKKVLSVVFSGFPFDPRPRREADALVEAGFELDMICLNEGEQKKEESLYGVNVHRININRKRNSKIRYIVQYFYFILISFFVTTKLYLKKRYDFIHIHNMPEILVFSATIPKIMGAKIILDLHDPMPEVYMTKYKLSKKHPIITILKFLEKISIKFSDIVITPNIAFKKLFISRGCMESKINIIMNSPMEKIFTESLPPTNREHNPERNLFRIMFHGYIAEHNGLSLSLEAISIVKKEIPAIWFDIFGDGEGLEMLRSQVDLLGLDENVKFHGRVDQSVIAENIIRSDLGIVPNQKTPFTEINFPTRIFEFLCLKKPVIVPRTIGVMDYFPEESICYFEPGNSVDLACKIIHLRNNSDAIKELVYRGGAVYEEHRWELQKATLVKLFNGLIEIPETDTFKNRGTEKESSE